MSNLPFGEVSPAEAHAKGLGPVGYRPTAPVIDDPMLPQVDHWFTYHTPTATQVEQMRVLREKAKDLARFMVSHCPPSADRSAAIRLLRESIMTANASIVLGGK